MKAPINVEDFRKLAKRRLPAIVFDYLEGGAEDEDGLTHNREVFRQIRFQPQRLRNVQTRDMSIRLFGRAQTAPLVIAPTGLNGLLWPDGDIALATAASKAGIPFALSTASNASIEEVRRRVDGDLWFQLYMVHPALTERLLKRALAADYSTLVVTVDVVINGNRERDRRNGFAFPLRYTPSIVIDGLTHPRWTMRLLRNRFPRMANLSAQGEDDLEVQAALLKRQMDAGFDWDGLARIRALWPRRLLVKGILHAADAQRCMACSADGVILSNHGGRQLESCISPIEVLRETADRVAGPVLVDSGIRRGADVVKAVALGASAVLLGRSVLYGLAVAGERGVSEVLGILKREIDETMAHIGCASMADLSGDYLGQGSMAHAEVSVSRDLLAGAVARELPSRAKA
jgi:(S)-mandelate dehydrogenase